MLSLLFTGVISIWASRKLDSLINHNTASTMLTQWNIPLGAKWHRVCRFAPRSGQNGLIPHYLISLYLKNRIIYAYISWLNTCIVIVSVFLPNIMTFGWIYLTWDQFFLSYAILPRLPLHNIAVIRPTLLPLQLSYTSCCETLHKNTVYNFVISQDWF